MVINSPCLIDKKELAIPGQTTTGLFAPPTIDLSNSGLKEFQQPEFEGYGFKANKGIPQSGIVPVNAARPINTVAPKSFVNVSKTRPNAFQKSHSPSKRPFYQQIALKNRNLNDIVNNAKVNSVNTAKGKRVSSLVGQGINMLSPRHAGFRRPKINLYLALDPRKKLILLGAIGKCVWIVLSLCLTFCGFKKLRDASFKDSEINALNIQIEKLKKEKESNQIKIDNFENASKSLDKLIGSQISKNNRKGMGYNDVPPPPTGLFAPLTIDLSNSGLKEFQQPEFEGYRFKVNKGVCENSSNEIKKTTDAPIIKDWVSDCDKDDSEVMVLKSNNVQYKPEQANQPKKVSQNLRNNKTNWNEIKTQKVGVGFQFTKKACFVCGSFNHLIKDCDLWNVVPTTVLTKSGKVPVSAAMPINTVAPKSFVNVAKTRPNTFQKSHSPSRRPFYQQTVLKNKNLNDKVNNAKINSVNTAKGKKVISLELKVDFLDGSHLRYDLTVNHTLYVSLIEEFWQTVTVDTVNDGEQQLSVTVNGQTIAITESSIRRHIQLADADGNVDLKP
ncbi:hypothetical protein Tco_1134036 [Tanacetum coccineum]